jgi:hypothetical protein
MTKTSILRLLLFGVTYLFSTLALARPIDYFIIANDLIITTEEVCSWLDEGVWCVSIEAYGQHEVQGKTNVAFISISEWTDSYDQSQSSFRWMNQCPISPQSIVVHAAAGTATLNATVDTANCWYGTGGYKANTETGTWEPWGFNALVPVSLTLSDPATYGTGVSNNRTVDTLTGSHYEESCHISTIRFFASLSGNVDGLVLPSYSTSGRGGVALEGHCRDKDMPRQ